MDKTPVVPSFPHSAGREGGSFSPVQEREPADMEKQVLLTVGQAYDAGLSPPVSAATPPEGSLDSADPSTAASHLVRDAMSTSVTDTSISTIIPDVLSNVPSRSQSPTPVSSDILLPILIYSVVKSNPPQLVSHVLYTQRYRHRSASGGEEGFCLINIMAVAEFLENVDMTALGLTETDRVRYVTSLFVVKPKLNSSLMYICAASRTSIRFPSQPMHPFSPSLPPSTRTFLSAYVVGSNSKSASWPAQRTRFSLVL